MPAPAAAQVRIEAVEMGFSNVYRPGHMVPLFVKLATDGGEPIDGELRAVQTDDDGEQLYWRRPAPLAGTQAQWRQVLICPQPGALEDGSLSVSYGSTDGGAYRPAASVPLGGYGTDGDATMPVPPRAAADGQWVLGVIGPGPGAWRLPASPVVHTGEPVAVVTVPVGRVPVQWQGLDMVDVLIWEDPQPDRLTDEQRDALVQWVWRGGHLVVALGSHARELTAAGDLASILPVRAEQLAVQVLSMRALYAALGRPGGREGGVVVRVTPRRGARVMAREAREGLPLLCRWAKGAGSVTVMSTTGDQAGFGRLSNADHARCLAALAGVQVRNGPVGGSDLPLTDELAAHLDSTDVGKWLVVVVILLCIVYALAAGPGTWMLARLTKRTHLSWWWFGGVVAIATGASVLFSLFGVRGESAANAMVLDLTGGSTYGVAQGYVGLYIPAHRAPEVTADGDPRASLTPMIRVATPLGGGFDGYPDPRAYTVDLAEPTTLEPYVRRTIKRLAVNWRGDVGHTVRGRADLGVENDPLEGPRVVVTGRITNDLPADLTGAVLLVAPGGRGDPIVAVRLGAIDAGATLRFSTARTVPAGRRKVGGVPLATLHKQMRLPGDVLFTASRKLGFLQEVQLLSTLSRYDQPDDGKRGARVYRRSLVRLDRCDQVHGGQALLIARANRYLPVPLRVDGDEVPATGETIVRVLLPAHRAATAADAVRSDGIDRGGNEEF
ncbi:MAG: hypothetical protein ACOC95_07105 [Planctomycetota bacterium]